MKHSHSQISRRTVSRTIAGAALAGLAGCLGGSDSTQLGSQDQFSSVGVDGTKLVVELAEGAEVEQINLIKPNGALFGQRTVATEADQVSFELRTTYIPGEYRVVALRGEESVSEVTTEISPSVQINEIGLFRNFPNKPWDDIYGDTQTDRLKNGEVFVTVENTGTGPASITKLYFSGDVPNPVENPWNNGISNSERVILAPGEEMDLFSNSFPFGSVSENGMGCSPTTNRGRFTVTLETETRNTELTRSYDVDYSGSQEMSDCMITITEV